jgi:hypothetical protein
MALWQQLRLAGLGTIFLGSWVVMIATGCSFLLQQGPSDLRFRDVSLIYCSQAPGCSGGSSDRKVLVVTLVTNRDLGADIFDSRATIIVRARTCSRSSPAIEIGAMGPYYGDMKLDGYEFNAPRLNYETLVAKQPKGTPFTYKIWFEPKEERESQTWPPYDLGKQPRDICISIDGNPYMGLGMGVSTNEVRIPEAAIAATLKAGLP